MVRIKWPEELAFLGNRNAVQRTTEALLTGKVCVLTGATSGVGLAAAKRLAQGGAQLVMVCRNEAKAKGLLETVLAPWRESIRFVIADFQRLSDVRSAAREILAMCPRIDALINCAGMHSTTRRMTEEGFEMVFCVNHLAAFLLTQLLWERLLTSAPARILQINSEGHRFNGLDLNDLNWERRRYRGLKGYGASKTAQLLTVWEMAKRLQGTRVTINAMHPGDVKSDIGSNNGWLYRCFSRHVTQRFLRDPAVSGDAIYYLVAAPGLAETSGCFFHLTLPEVPAKHARDQVTGERMYAISRTMTGLT